MRNPVIYVHLHFCNLNFRKLSFDFDNDSQISAIGAITRDTYPEFGWRPRSFMSSKIRNSFLKPFHNFKFHSKSTKMASSKCTVAFIGCGISPGPPYTKVIDSQQQETWEAPFSTAFSMQHSPKKPPASNCPNDR